jgi:hypothetical protein
MEPQVVVKLIVWKAISQTPDLFLSWLIISLIFSKTRDTDKMLEEQVI